MILGGTFWRAAATPAGPATLAVTQVTLSGVAASAWGSGAAWLLEHLPRLVGGGDHPGSFHPAHPLLHHAARAFPGLRIPCTASVFDQLVPAILEQLVTGVEARRSWRQLVSRYGTPAPGVATGEVPAVLRVPPGPTEVRAIPDWEWHRAGIDGRRRRTILAAAAVARRLEESTALPPATAIARLRAVPGVGAWTAAEVAQRSFGDADAVSVGDYHLPSIVGYALTGQRTDDAGMLDLLAPYAPHRHRVVRLIECLGVRPPRRAPRLAVRDYRAY